MSQSYQVCDDLLLPVGDGVLEVLDGGVLHLLPALGGAVGDHVLVQGHLAGECLAAVAAGQLGQHPSSLLLRSSLIQRNIFILEKY